MRVSFDRVKQRYYATYIITQQRLMQVVSNTVTVVASSRAKQMIFSTSVMMVLQMETPKMILQLPE